MHINTAQKLVNHFGGKAETCKAMEVSGETVRLWLRDGLPLHRAIDFEQKSKGAITAEEILKETKANTRKAQREAQREARAA